MKLCKGMVDFGVGVTEEHQPIAYQDDVQVHLPSYIWLCPLCSANITRLQLEEEIETLEKEIGELKNEKDE